MQATNNLLPRGPGTTDAATLTNKSGAPDRESISGNTAKMKILVVLANFGTKNDSYMKRLLDEYSSMPFDVHPVLLTNVPKNLGEKKSKSLSSPRPAIRGPFHSRTRK